MLPVDLNGVPVETSLLFPGCRLDFCVAPAPADVRRAPRRPGGRRGGGAGGLSAHRPVPRPDRRQGRDPRRGRQASLTLAFDNEARPGSKG